jgi:hypothetical protein
MLAMSISCLLILSFFSAKNKIMSDITMLVQNIAYEIEVAQKITADA